MTILRDYAAGAEPGALVRQHGISRATLCYWQTQYGGLTVSDAKRFKTLVDKNRRLKRLLAVQALNLQILKDFLGKALTTGERRSVVGDLPAVVEARTEGSACEL